MHSIFLIDIYLIREFLDLWNVLVGVEMIQHFCNQEMH
jgi:hypothetical protein